jgi:anti-anti-sigma regulatory factor
MNISVREMQGGVPVTVLGVQGDLDASNYQDLMAKAAEVYGAGAKDILLDWTGTPFVSSSGLVALHSIALMMSTGQPIGGSEDGWGAIQAMRRGLPTGVQQHIKLLGPQPNVVRTLEKAGMREFFEIHTDLDTAVASF